LLNMLEVDPAIFYTPELIAHENHNMHYHPEYIDSPEQLKLFKQALKE